MVEVKIIGTNVIDSDAATTTTTPCCHHKEAKLEAGKSSCAMEKVMMLARRFSRWLAEWPICSENRSLSRISARKGGVREIRY